MTSPTTLPLPTARYASPEQLRGEPVTTASDVYSLGVLLFELLTGAWPYETRGFTASEIITAITAQDARTASQVNRELVCGGVDGRSGRDYRQGFGERARAAVFVGRELFGGHSKLSGGSAGESSPDDAGISDAPICAPSLGGGDGRGDHRPGADNGYRHLDTRGSQRESGAGPVGKGYSFLGRCVDRGESWESQFRIGAKWDLKLVDVMAAASNRLSEKFGDDPGVQAELHAAIGRTYIGLGKIDAAQPEVKIALDHLSALDARPGEKARVPHVVARLNFEMGDLKSGEAREREALALFARSPDAKTDLGMYSTVLNNLGMFLRGRGKTSEALEAFTRAVGLLESLPVPPAFETGLLHNNISLLASQGRSVQSPRGTRVSYQAAGSRSQEDPY